MLGPVFALVLMQSAPQPTVAPIFQGQEQIVTVVEAQRLLATTTDRSLQVALVLALGTVPCTEDEARGTIEGYKSASCRAQRRAGLI